MMSFQRREANERSHRIIMSIYHLSSPKAGLALEEKYFPSTRFFSESDSHCTIFCAVNFLGSNLLALIKFIT